MTNKVGIDVEGRLDTAAIIRQVNDMGGRIAQANKVQYKPVSEASVKDLERMVKQFEQLRKISGDLSRRMNATGQGGKSFFDVEWDSLYPDQHSRARQMRKTFGYVVGDRFGPAAGGGGGGGGGGGAGVGVGIAQAGLRSAGPVGGVAASALGTGMSAGAGAGLMGLLGGLGALGIGKLVGGVMENVGKAEDNAVALDKLKRTLGDVNVSFNALKTVVRGGADALKITYSDATGLAQQFVKQGNVGSGQFGTLGAELGVGVGMSRAFGMDPAQGMGFLGGMRGVGMTTNTQESRRIALLIGETIGKSGAFAKAEEVMDAIAGFATSQTRQNMGRANVDGYAGMFAGLVGSGIPGLDPTGAGALLARVNASLSAGGAKGEASQFFTAQVGQRMGLDPIMTQIMREGGAFATNDSMFGGGSIYSRYMGKTGPGGGGTFLQGTLDQLRGQYGSNKGMLAQATANHLGVGINQAMALLSVDPQQMGEMQKYGNLGTLSGSGIGNLSKALYGSAGDRAQLAQSMLGRSDVSDTDKSTLRGALGTSQEREVLAKLTAQYDQERTMGSDIRDSKSALDNIKTALADRLVPLTQTMRDGIVLMAGKGKSPREISEEVARLESKDRQDQIHGDFESRKRSAIGEANTILEDRKKALDNLKANRANMTPEQVAAEQKRIIGLTDQYTNKAEEVRQRLLKLMEEEAAAIKEEVEARDKRIKDMRLSPTPASSVEVTGSIAGAGRGVINPQMVGGGSGGMSSSSASSGSVSDAMKFFMGKGWSKEQAAGIVANLFAESKMSAGAVGDGGRAYGIAQWHPDRQANFRAWAGKDIRGSTAEEQMGFVHYELTQGAEQGAGNALKGAGSAAAAGGIISSQYERPKWRNSEMIKRGAMADRIYSATPEQVPETKNSGQAASVGTPTAEVTVKVVNEKGQQIAPTQTVQTKVSTPKPFGSTAH